MPANNRFQELGKAIWSAFTSGRMADAKRVFDDFMNALDESDRGGGGNRTNHQVGDKRFSPRSLPSLNQSAGDVQNPLGKQAAQGEQNVAESKQTVMDANAGYNLRLAVVAQGEGVVPGVAVCVVDNVAYVADASNSNRPCHGVCVRGTGEANKVYWRAGGTVTVKVKRNGNPYSALYLSDTAGWLTNDPNDSASGQVVGHFGRWTLARDGVKPDTAEINLTLAYGVSSGGGGGDASEIVTTGTAKETLAAGDLVFKDNYGNVYQATADSQWRYATGVAKSGAAIDAEVTIVVHGTVLVSVDSEMFYDHTNTYYLSETAGVATCKPVMGGVGTKMWQPVGFGVDEPAGGKVLMQLAISPDWVWV